MNKSIEQLEQEAQQARDSAIEALNFESFNKALFVNRMIDASVAMVTYQLALGMQEVSGDGGGKSLPEYIEKRMKSNIAENQDYLTRDGSGESLPEVSQEERDSDGWIVWNGGSCPIDENVKVELKFRSSQYENIIDYAGGFSWYPKDDGTDIIAYRIVK